MEKLCSNLLLFIFCYRWYNFYFSILTDNAVFIVFFNYSVGCLSFCWWFYLHNRNILVQSVYFLFFPVYRGHVHDIISKTYIIGLPPIVSYRGLRLLALCLSLQRIFSLFLCMTSVDIHFVLRHTNVVFSQLIYGLFLTIVYYEDLCLYWFQGIFFYSIALRSASLPLFCLLQLCLNVSVPHMLLWLNTWFLALSTGLDEGDHQGQVLREPMPFSVHSILPG